jgi:hypothetical protein
MASLGTANPQRKHMSAHGGIHAAHAAHAAHARSVPGCKWSHAWLGMGVDGVLPIAVESDEKVCDRLWLLARDEHVHEQLGWLYRP